MNFLKRFLNRLLKKRECVLVFSQYASMTEELDDYLAEIFGRKGLVINGSTPVKTRTEYATRFNEQKTYIPYMVLSLKAAGTGLNLVAANHVIHFDRWWNPAVENQATDRAFRIGQKKMLWFISLSAKEQSKKNRSAHFLKNSCWLIL